MHGSVLHTFVEMAQKPSLLNIHIWTEKIQIPQENKHNFATESRIQNIQFFPRIVYEPPTGTTGHQYPP